MTLSRREMLKAQAAGVAALAAAQQQDPFRRLARGREQLQGLPAGAGEA